MDSLSKLEEHDNSINELFGNIFGSKDKKIFQDEQVGFSVTYGNVKNFIRNFDSGGEKAYDNLTWTSKYRWLLESRWNASLLSFKNDKVIFNGTWSEGVFQGNEFGTNGVSVFNGGFFKGGKFSSKNEFFKVPVHNFISGTFSDCKEGVLGHLNCKSKNYNSISFITIPVGATLIINGIHKIIINKRIDNVSADFKLTILNGNKNYDIEWETIRKAYESGFGNLTIGSSHNIFGIFTKPFKITSLRVDTTPALVSPNPTSAPKPGNSNTQNSGKYIVDMSELYNLKIFRRKIIFEAFPVDEDDKKRINQLIEDLKSGKFAKNLQKLKFILKIDTIKVDTQYRYLRELFKDYNQGVYLDSEVTSYLKYLNNFMDIIEHNTGNSKPNVISVKEMILSNLKSYLKLVTKKPIAKKPLNKNNNGMTQPNF